MITFVGAFVVAFALQVDTPAIVNRLSADEQLRQQLVKDAETLYAENAGAASPRRRFGAPRKPRPPRLRQRHRPP